MHSVYYSSNPIYMTLSCYFILETNEDLVFESHLKEGKDINMNRETFAFIKNLLNNDDVSIEKNIKLHPFYLQVPLLRIQETYEYLRLMKFDDEVISKCLQILLYPM